VKGKVGQREEGLCLVSAFSSAPSEPFPLSPEGFMNELIKGRADTTPASPLFPSRAAGRLRHSPLRIFTWSQKGSWDEGQRPGLGFN